MAPSDSNDEPIMRCRLPPTKMQNHLQASDTSPEQPTSTDARHTQSMELIPVSTVDSVNIPYPPSDERRRRRRSPDLQTSVPVHSTDPRFLSPVHIPNTSEERRRSRRRTTRRLTSPDTPHSMNMFLNSISSRNIPPQSMDPRFVSLTNNEDLSTSSHGMRRSRRRTSPELSHSLDVLPTSTGWPTRSRPAQNRSSDVLATAISLSNMQIGPPPRSLPMSNIRRTSDVLATARSLADSNVRSDSRIATIPSTGASVSNTPEASTSTRIVFRHSFEEESREEHTGGISGAESMESLISPEDSEDEQPDINSHISTVDYVLSTADRIINGEFIGPLNEFETNMALSDMEIFDTEEMELINQHEWPVADEFSEYNRKDLLDLCTVLYNYDQNDNDEDANAIAAGGVENNMDHRCSICLKDMYRGDSVR